VVARREMDYFTFVELLEESVPPSISARRVLCSRPRRDEHQLARRANAADLQVDPPGGQRPDWELMTVPGRMTVSLMRNQRQVDVSAQTAAPGSSRTSARETLCHLTWCNRRSAVAERHPGYRPDCTFHVMSCCCHAHWTVSPCVTVRVLPNNPLMDQGAACGGAEVAESAHQLACPPGRSRSLRAAWRPCSRGSARRARGVARRAGRQRCLARWAHCCKSGALYARPTSGLNSRA
jgi:hypothetical protein